MRDISGWALLGFFLTVALWRFGSMSWAMVAGDYELAASRAQSWGVVSWAAVKTYAGG